MGLVALQVFTNFPSQTKTQHYWKPHSGLFRMIFLQNPLTKMSQTGLWRFYSWGISKPTTLVSCRFSKGFCWEFHFTFVSTHHPLPIHPAIWQTSSVNSHLAQPTGGVNGIKGFTPKPNQSETDQSVFDLASSGPPVKVTKFKPLSSLRHLPYRVPIILSTWCFRIDKSF